MGLMLVAACGASLAAGGATRGALPIVPAWLWAGFRPGLHSAASRRWAQRTRARDLPTDYVVADDALFLLGIAGIALTRSVQRWGAARVGPAVLRLALSIVIVAGALVL